MAKPLDVIIFGATGFTGKYCVLEAVKVLQGFSWGIAGRNKDKLENVLKDVQKETNADLSKIPIVIADVQDDKALASMVQQAKVIVNCCGPYCLYGEPVVKACINSGTHQVDITGEHQYMERMQLEYNDLARQKGSYIVSACGFGSIPADLGTLYCEQNFDGVVNSVEAYLEAWIEGSTRGAFAHSSSWESILRYISNMREMREIRSKLYKQKLPTTKPKLKTKFSIFKSPVANAYLFPFSGVDEPVVERTQRFLYENENKRPVQMKAYFAFKSLFGSIAMIFAISFVGIFAQIPPIRYLMIKYPRFFTLGSISEEGPSKEKANNTKFVITLHAEGWRKEDKLAESTDEYSIPPNKKLIAKITGYNPCFGATSVGLLVSAVTILKENNKLPSTGGVFTPGAAFAKTNMISELGKYDTGFKFEIIQK